MKLSYIGEQSHNTVLNHTKNITLGVREGSEAVILENEGYTYEGDLPVLNWCIAVNNLIDNKELRETFKELYSLEDVTPGTYLYGFISKGNSSDFLEMTYDSHLMAGGVGPKVGLAKATAIRVDQPYDAVAGLSDLVEGIQAMGYVGEITIGITKEFTPCSVTFGHFTPGFALYCELARVPMEEYYVGCVTDQFPAGLHERALSVVNMVSVPPFPGNIHYESDMQYPPDAEKHVYRRKFMSAEIAYVGAWGTSIHEAKRRVRLSLDNLTTVNPDLQYRIDYGYKEDFVINHDKWLAFGGVLPIH